jgi:hypothetical protein
MGGCGVGAGHDTHEDDSSSNDKGSGHDREQGGLGHAEALADVAESVAETVPQHKGNVEASAQTASAESVAKAVIGKQQVEASEAAEGESRRESQGAAEGAAQAAGGWLGWVQGLNPWRKSAVERQLQRGGPGAEAAIEEELEAAARELQEQAAEQQQKEGGPQKSWWRFLPWLGDSVDGQAAEKGEAHLLCFSKDQGGIIPPLLALMEGLLIIAISLLLVLK